MSNDKILTLSVCVIFDRIACVFSAPMSFQNDECGKRYMADTFKGKPSASDYELYKIGTFNIETGVFEVLENKDFICRGEFNGEEK